MVYDNLKFKNLTGPYIVKTPVINFLSIITNFCFSNVRIIIRAGESPPYAIQCVFPRYLLKTLIKHTVEQVNRSVAN